MPVGLDNGMKEADDIARRVLALQKQFDAKLGVKSRTLSQALRRAGRRLPRRLRAQGRQLVEAQKRLGNPVLARQLDWVALERAFQDISAHLAAIDVAGRRKDRILDLAALIAFYILVVVVAFVFWLWWRGYV